MEYTCLGYLAVLLVFLGFYFFCLDFFSILFSRRSFFLSTGYSLHIIINIFFFDTHSLRLD
jgi:hypothetical protein